MKHVFILLCLMGSLISSTVAQSASPKKKSLTAEQRARLASWTRADVVKGVVVVKYKPDAGSFTRNSAWKKSAALTQAFSALRVKRESPLFQSQQAAASGAAENTLNRITLVAFAADTSPQDAASSLMTDDAIEYAEPFFIRKITSDGTAPNPSPVPNTPLAVSSAVSPNDPFYTDGSSWWLSKINAEGAWAVTEGDTSLIIGIVDSGVQYDHPDLASKALRNWNEIPNNGIDDDGNGFVDDVFGWDFGGVNHLPGDTNPPDNNPDEGTPYHGTHVAGVAAGATNNGVGIASIGYRSRFLAVKAGIDSEPQNIYYGYEGILYAAERGAKIICCSWGGFGYSQAEQDVITYVTTVKNALVVAAAGNQNNDNDLDPFYPAGYGGVLSVGATAQNDTKAGFSNYGIQNCDLTAPGVAIRSTWKPSTYLLKDGTSFSAPLTAGVAALVKKQFPDYTAEQIGEQIRITSDDIDALNPAFTRRLGRGRLNAARAVSEANAVAIRLTKVAFEDANQNGNLEAGERVKVELTFKNYLAPSAAVSVTVTPTNPAIAMNTPSVTFSPLTTLQTSTTKTVEFTVPAGATQDALEAFDVQLTSGAYTDYARFTAVFRATYLTLAVSGSAIQTSFNSRGNFGYSDFATNSQGIGFVYRSSDMLYEGALMLGTSPATVEDAARTSQTQQQKDFTAVSPVSFLSTPDRIEGNAVFNDSLVNAAARLKVKVLSSLFVFGTAPDTSYAILRYRIINEQATALTNFYAGVWADWDVVTYAPNISGYDAATGTGYTYHAPTNTYAGLRCLSDAAGTRTSFRTIPFDSTVSVTKTQKWNYMSGGRASASGNGDLVNIIGTGPYTLNSGDTLTLGFALLAGKGFPALVANANFALSKWAALLSGTPPVPPPQPLQFSLAQNYPNPFNPATTITYNLAQGADVTLKLYDALGREVRTLDAGRKFAGEQRVALDASGLASGVYFYRLVARSSGSQAAAFTATKQLVIVK